MKSTELQTNANLISTYRGLAALLVSLGHLEQVFIRPSTKIFSPYAGLLAQASVMIFFVISGYSIASSVSHLINKPNPVYEYALKRTCRVIPPLVAALALMYILFLMAPYFFASHSNDFIKGKGLVRTGLYFDVSQVLGSLFFLNGFFTDTPNSNGPLWSLSYEVWLYGIFFGLFYAVWKKRFIAIISVVLAYILLVYLDKSADLLFLKYSFIWFLGAACRLLPNNAQSSQSLKPILQLFFIVSVLASIYCGYRFVTTEMKSDISVFNIWIGVTFSIYLSFSNYKIKLRTGIGYRLLNKAADFSYTLYLIHFPLYLFVFGITQAFSEHTLAIICITYAITIYFAHMISKFSENRPYFIRLARMAT